MTTTRPPAEEEEEEGGSRMARTRWRSRGSELEDRARERRPEAASESPREVNRRRKKTRTAAKKAAAARSRSVH